MAQVKLPRAGSLGNILCFDKFQVYSNTFKGLIIILIVDILLYRRREKCIIRFCYILHMMSMIIKPVSAGVIVSLLNIVVLILITYLHCVVLIR